MNDSKAVHGYTPNWDRQRRKQEEAAKEYYDEADEEEVREWLDSEDSDK